MINFDPRDVVDRDLLEFDGARGARRCRARQIETADRDTLNSFVKKTVDERVSLIATDDFRGYRFLNRTYPVVLLQAFYGATGFACAATVILLALALLAAIAGGFAAGGATRVQAALA